MVNAVEMENFFDVVNSSSPPIEVAPAQFIPAIVRDAPILSPFLGERVNLEDLLRWCSAAPIQIEDGAVGPDIGAEAAHAKGDVAHEIDALRGGVRLELLPLGEGEPLDVHEEKLLAHEFIAAGFRKR